MVWTHTGAGRSHQLLSTIVGLTLLCASPLLAAPSIEALYLEDSVLPGASALPGFSTSDEVRNNGGRFVSVNAYGDFIGPVHTNADDSIYYHFGAVGGATPAALRRESMLAGEDQNVFIARIGISPAGVSTYAALVRENPSQTFTGAASLWQDDTLIYREGDVVPSGALAGKFFGEVTGSVFVSPSGEASWLTSFADTSLGSDVGVALIRGTTDFTPLLKSGDSIGTEGIVANSGSFVFTNPRFSHSATNYVTAVTIDGTNESVGVINGMPVILGSGNVLRDDTPIDPLDGGRTQDGIPIETWSIGSNFAINEAGDYLIDGFTELTTDGDTNVDDTVLIYNGTIIHREGEILDGVPLTGVVEGVGINDRGDIVFAWNDTIFINGQAVVDTSSQIDLDGNGSLDTTLARLAVGQLTVTNQTAAGGDDLPVIYFGGSVSAGDRSSMMRFVPAELSAGDFNQDGLVDAADYPIWRDTLGSTTDIRADADRSGVVDDADYLLWKANYGTLPASVELGTQVPEPSILAMGWVAVCLLCLRKPVRKHAALG